MAYQAGMQEEITVRKGPWREEEDKRLATFVTLMGERRWDSIARVSGLRRSGKSCRLRWLNYLRPDLKRGRMSEEEEHVILQLQKQWGNKWSKIARRLPGRTDNEIKNYWRTHLRKKEVQVQKQEIVLQGEKTNVASNSWSSSKAIEHGGYVNEDMLRPSKDFLDGLEFRDHRVLSFLPWETGLVDWISDNQNSPKHQEHCLLGCSSCSPGWLCGDADSTWNCSLGSMWDT